MKPNRIHYIDNVKVLLTCMVVAHHAGQAYGATGGVWLVNDVSKANFLKPFFFINAAYMMGLYFFISGYFMMFTLERKNVQAFMADRLKRLGIPLLFFCFAIFLPLHYALSDKQQSLFYFFIDLYYNKPPLAFGHLWFVASLLVYTFLYLTVNAIIGQQRTYLFRTWYPLLYIVLLALVTALVRNYYAIDVWRTWLVPVEVSHIPQYLSMFWLGTIFYRQQWLAYLQGYMAIMYGALALVATLPLLLQPAWLPQHVLSEALLEACMCVGISVGLMAVFKKWCNATHRFIALLSANAYGIYLFHLLIVIAWQVVFEAVAVSGTLKFIIVTVLGIMSSLLFSYLLRRIKLIRSII
jgi:surface polysaccharide O-acyltransferase-like enzyme